MERSTLSLGEMAAYSLIRFIFSWHLSPYRPYVIGCATDSCGVVIGGPERRARCCASRRPVPHPGGHAAARGCHGWRAYCSADRRGARGTGRGGAGVTRRHEDTKGAGGGSVGTGVTRRARGRETKRGVSPSPPASRGAHGAGGGSASQSAMVSARARADRCRSDADRHRIWLRNSRVRSCWGLANSASGVPCSTICP